VHELLANPVDYIHDMPAVSTRSISNVVRT
jgi:hypothetical protein